jgi:hypothetical protein
MGLSLVPSGVGGLVGGVLSGRLIAAHLPKGGALHPFSVWGTYAAIGVGCSLVLAIFAAIFKGPGPKPEPEPNEPEDR